MLTASRANIGLREAVRSHRSSVASSLPRRRPKNGLYVLCEVEFTARFDLPKILSLDNPILFPNRNVAAEGEECQKAAGDSASAPASVLEVDEAVLCPLPELNVHVRVGGRCAGRTAQNIGKAYDSNAIRELAAQRGAWANIPPKKTRTGSFPFSQWVYKQRNLIERYFNKLKHFRGIATRYDRDPVNFLAAVKLPSVRIWLKSYESAA